MCFIFVLFSPLYSMHFTFTALLVGWRLVRYAPLTTVSGNFKSKPVYVFISFTMDWCGFKIVLLIIFMFIFILLLNYIIKNSCTLLSLVKYCLNGELSPHILRQNSAISAMKNKQVNSGESQCMCRHVCTCAWENEKFSGWMQLRFYCVPHLYLPLSSMNTVTCHLSLFTFNHT